MMFVRGWFGNFGEDAVARGGRTTSAWWGYGYPPASHTRYRTKTTTFYPIDPPLQKLTI